MNLLNEFPAISTLAWEQKIKEDLKGADYVKKLVWKTKEGFDVKPYYRKEDLEKSVLSENDPTVFPFIRGSKDHNQWHIRQEIKVVDLKDANVKALDILMKGITSLGFKLEKDLSEPELETLTSNIFADAIEMNFLGIKKPIELIEIIDRLIKKYNRDINAVHGSIDYDPLGNALISGYWEGDTTYDLLKKLTLTANHLRGYQVITVNAKNFRNAGSTISEELGFGLAQGVNYLTQLSERGLAIDEIASRIRFNFGVGSDYFMEIAKFRAARFLWAHIVNAYGCAEPSATAMHVHAETLQWNKTTYDAYVNLLRTSTEAMAAIIAGTDSLTVIPFNATFEESTEIAERLARNQQLLLKEEAYLDKVVDPAAGSYYIENLTTELARKAWEYFLKVQENGGFLEAVKSGFIQKHIEETAKQRDLNIAFGKEVLLGTNRYPREDDKVVLSLGKVPPTMENQNVLPLKLYRGAEPFEKLRKRTENFGRENNIPRVFLLQYGNIPMSQARAQFSFNFFSIAGFKIINPLPFKNIEKGIAEFNKSGADMLVFCSDDPSYLELTKADFTGFEDEKLLVVAGYPKEYVSQLEQAGIHKFIFLGMNILETLSSFQQMLGISK